MKTKEKSKDTKWTLDQAHSEISFRVRHLMIAHVNGSFKNFDANIYTNEKNFNTAEIDFWIDPASISTGDTKRDEHLKSADFFDVEKHKQITFVSSTVGKADADGKHELWGELTMKGITKNVHLEIHYGGIVTDPWGNEKAGFEVLGKINRNDWDLKWNSDLSTGGLMVGEEISISCEIELINAGERELTMELESDSLKEK